MREIFDRHAERLSAEERRAIGRAVSGPRARASWPRLQWALATAAALLAVGTITVAIVRRDPPVAQRPVPGTRAGASEPAKSLASADPAPARDAAARPAETGAPVARGEDVTGVPREKIARLLAQADSSRARPSASPPLTAPVPASVGRIAGRVTERGREPQAYANVALVGKQRGALTDENGNFQITGVPPGTYTLRASRVGGDKVEQDVVVVAGETVTGNFEFGEARAIKTLAEIEVKSDRRIDRRGSASKQTISAEKLKELPVDNLRDAVATKAGVAAQGGELHFRGGRSNDVHLVLDGLEASDPLHGRAAPQPPVVPTTGGTALPNDEPYDSMFFKNYGVNPFIATDEDSLSTFAVDVDAGSYTVARRYIELGQMPPADAVRVEEFVNYFSQGYPRFENDDFRILLDGAPSPFGQGHHLLRVGLKGREIADRDRKTAHLTFVIDVSGSMAREDRLELVKQSLRVLVNHLHQDDRVGLVVYGSMGRVLLEPTALGESIGLVAAGRRHREDPEASEPRARWAGRRRILEAIDHLRPEGSTNAEHGLSLGYEMARRGYRPDAINRIVLCSDGVANVGVTGPQSILGRVRTEADRGIHLSTIGFGMGNYNDVLMEQLANQGDGNYYYVDDLDEARRVFVENLAGTLQTIAKDAKIQVEFHSSRVLRYRLLGFENRDVADRDFRNDKVDAGEIGAGHEVTALYEVKLAPGAEKGPIATVRLRYARPEHEGGGAPDVREIAADFRSAGLHERFEDASPHFRLDASVAEFAEILRGSYWAKDGRLSDVLSVARKASRGVRSDAATEFVQLAERALQLSRSLQEKERKEER